MAEENQNQEHNPEDATSTPEGTSPLDNLVDQWLKESLFNQGFEGRHANHLTQQAELLKLRLRDFNKQ